MSVELITEDILKDSNFLSATEQESEYIGQPAITGASIGGFRLLSSGDIADFTYDGTATGNGAGGGTTVIDSLLAAYGDDYFIGGMVEITSGAANGETKAVTDFAQATGTLTMAAFTAQIVIGVTFTLTVAFATRDFDVELVTGGDAGTATFKWSHDGETTYLGRDDPNQANWLAENEINGTEDCNRAPLTQAANGNLVCVYNVTNKIYYRISSNNGLTWAAAVELSADDYSPYCIITLSSGRILLFTDNLSMYYSDDNGVTWSSANTVVSNFSDVIELNSGNLIGTTIGITINVYISSDGGFTWSSSILVAGGPDYEGALVEAENGDVICFYSEDVPAGGNFQIKCAISSDGGATWGAEIGVMSDAGVADMREPRAVKDIDGIIFCVAWHKTGDQKLTYCISTDNGVTWGAKTTLKTVGGVDLSYPHLSLIDGHQILCTYNDATNSDIDFVRRGMWEAYVANACPTAIGAFEQKLICDVNIVWHGGGGIVADHWDFAAEYNYAMENIIADSPNKPFRSTQDNIECNIVIDLGANNRFFADGVAFFGCNVKTLQFEMNATDAWGAPTVSHTVSFDLDSSGVVDAIEGNVVEDAALMADYDDHFFRGDVYYLEMTSGTDDGKVWRILDNVGNFIFLDTTNAVNIAIADTFDIRQSWISNITIPGLTVYRYIRLSISAQQTAEDYYQLGTMVAGRITSLTDRWGSGYGKDHKYDVEMLRTPQGGLISVKNAGRKRIFTLTWPFSDATRKKITALLDYAEGRNIALVPDDGILTDAYLTKLIGPARQSGGIRDRFNLKIVLEEIL